MQLFQYVRQYARTKFWDFGTAELADGMSHCGRQSDRLEEVSGKITPGPEERHTNTGWGSYGATERRENEMTERQRDRRNERINRGCTEDGTPPNIYSGNTRASAECEKSSKVLVRGNPRARTGNLQANKTETINASHLYLSNQLLENPWSQVSPRPPRPPVACLHFYRVSASPLLVVLHPSLLTHCLTLSAMKEHDKKRIRKEVPHTSRHHPRFETSAHAWNTPVLHGAPP